jgi:hypothetical protein
MPTVEDHKEAAMLRLRRLAQPDSTPALDDTELNAILDDCQRASFWAPSKAFNYGDVVLPVTKNGHHYVCIQTGTTGPAEPAWPSRGASTVTDGTVKWREAGADFDNVFDVRAAAHQAWTIKAAKASEMFDSGNDSTSQIGERCREMAKSFNPIGLA